MWMDAAAKMIKAAAATNGGELGRQEGDKELRYWDNRMLCVVY